MTNWHIADLFELVADLVPEREAVVQGDRRLTYAELEDRANRLAHHLRAAGVATGEHVALDLYNSPEYLEAMLAVTKIRAVAVNVNYRYTAAELAYLLDDADAVAIIFHRSLTRSLAEAAGDLPRLRTFLAVEDEADGDLGGDYEAAVAGAPAGRDFPERSPDDLYLLYTGGTTGAPKGAMWRHEDVLRGGMLGPGGPDLRDPAELTARIRKGGVRTLPTTALMHGTGQFAAMNAILGGGTVVLSSDRHFAPEAVCRLIAAERVQLLSLVGDAVARPLADAAERLGLDLTCVRFVLSSGAILSAPVKEALGRVLPRVRILDALGSSESGANAQATDDDRFALGEHTVVLDDDLRPVAPGSGVPGRVAKRSFGAHGYWKDPVKSAATFPVIDGVRHVVIGDYVHLEADGTLTFVGRGSACINTAGEKVYPEEVEAVLKAHPDVFDALVVGVPDERFGQRVVAVIAPREGRTPAAADLQAHCRAELAGYKVPKTVVFRVSVRRSVTGKPDYAWARDEAM